MLTGEERAARARASQAKWREKNREKVREYARAYKQRPDVKERERISQRGRSRAHYLANRERILSANRELRLEVLAHYGTACACCGEKAEVFLSIDHVEDNGAEHRRTEKINGHSFYRWLKKNGFPEGFQTLCRNCNWAKHLGGCPHQETA